VFVAEDTTHLDLLYPLPRGHSQRICKHSQTLGLHEFDVSHSLDDLFFHVGPECEIPIWDERKAMKSVRTDSRLQKYLELGRCYGARSIRQSKTQFLGPVGIGLIYFADEEETFVPSVLARWCRWD
jgi:hypothetical protein